jgi:hypothetical protein
MANRRLTTWIAVISPNTGAVPCRSIQFAAYRDRSMPMVFRMTKMLTSASPVTYFIVSYVIEE